MAETTDDGAAAGSAGRHRTHALIHNAVSLMVSSGGTAVLGVAFWGVAARLAPPRNVGAGSAEIAAMVLLATLAQLSLGSIFTRFLPITGSRTRSFISRSYGLCAAAALGAVLIYILTGLGHRVVPVSLGWRLVFVASVVLWTIFILQDAALIGLRVTKWVPVENILFAAGKIALLPLFLALTPLHGIFLSWVVPLLVANVAVNWYLFRRQIPRHQEERPSSDGYPTRRELVGLGIAQYSISLINTLTSSLVILIVVSRLGPTANAYYYIPSLISGGAALLLWGVYTSFMVEVSNDPDGISLHAKVTLRTSLYLLVPGVIVGVAFAPLILHIFGAAYAAHGTTLLRLMLLSLPGTCVMGFYYSFAWIDKRIWWLAGRAVFAACILFGGLFALIGRYGILAAGIASLVASVLETCLFGPALIRRYRRAIETPLEATGAA